MTRFSRQVAQLQILCRGRYVTIAFIVWDDTCLHACLGDSFEITRFSRLRRRAVTQAGQCMEFYNNSPNVGSP